MQNRNNAAISALIMAALNNILGRAYSIINGPKEIHWITNINLKKVCVKYFYILCILLKGNIHLKEY